MATDEMREDSSQAVRTAQEALQRAYAAARGHPSTNDAGVGLLNALRPVVDEYAVLVRVWADAWAAATQSGMQMAFDAQSAFVDATLVVFDSSTQAYVAWLQRAAGTARTGWDVAGRVMATSADAWESTWSGWRR